MIYIPSYDYTLFHDRMKFVYEQRGLQCDEGFRPCYYNSKCSEISASAELNLDDVLIEITLTDQSGSPYQVKLTKGQLLVEGSITGDDDRCYIGVYQYPDLIETDNVYYFGAPFFNAYYVSLSLVNWNWYGSPEDGHLSVAFGPICPTAYLGDVVYNENYAHYNWSAGDNDISTKIADVTMRTDLNNTCKSAPSEPSDDGSDITPVPQPSNENNTNTSNTTNTTNTTLSLIHI